MEPHTLFLLGCIPTRLLLAYLVFVSDTFSEHIRVWMQVVLGLIGFSFLTLYITNSRMHAPEAGGVTWWHELRPIHGPLYVLAAALIRIHPQMAGSVLAFDALIGLLAGLARHR